MLRLIASIALAACAGVGVGFVWWGLPLQRLRDDVDRFAERAGRAGTPHDELEGLRARLATAQAELDRERARRARLDVVVGAGLK
jgi:hypothetical protein